MRIKLGPRTRWWALSAIVIFLFAGVGAQSAPPPSVNSTSQNRASQASAPVPEQPFTSLADYVLLAINDLGMHCANLDQRIISILPLFNVVHAQVIKKGKKPVILDNTQVQVNYSATHNPNDPAASATIPSSVFKTNFWDTNPRTGNSYAFDAYDPYYPPGILGAFALPSDLGLPTPDLQRLYFGDGQLAASQQAMPSTTAPLTPNPYVANDPQAFGAYYSQFPFFIDFPFGYTLPGMALFAAEGIPIIGFDDTGRQNSYPLMRIQAAATAGNALGLSAGTVIASLDTVVPVSAEVNCQNCHGATSDGGNGSATIGKGFTIAKSTDDPQYGKVPLNVSIGYAYALNVIRLHDKKNGTSLESETPVPCQKCHYSPALDLAHLGPKGPGDSDANGREQTLHHSMTRAMHDFHGALKGTNGKPLFAAMPLPKNRSLATRDKDLLHSCYECHPGATTKCFRGRMFNAGLACQDCHGSMSQVGNDFSANVSPSNPGAFIVRSDYYSNPATPRVPWANEPMCQSCHTGDAINSLAGTKNVIVSKDKITLMQAYLNGDKNTKPIVASNRRFAENQIGSLQVLYRLSEGHGGVLCEGCHGSTHAEWPNATAGANDNVAAKQLQGYSGTLIECSTCHGKGAFTISDFRGNFDVNGLMKGPHGMHPVADSMWLSGHHDVFEDPATPKNNCQSCHGVKLQGTVLSATPVDRTLPCADSGQSACSGGTLKLKAGQQVSCTLCHSNPLNGGD